jgi:hypothetical protein
MLINRLGIDFIKIFSIQAIHHYHDLKLVIMDKSTGRIDSCTVTKMVQEFMNKSGFSGQRKETKKISSCRFAQAT